MVDLRHVGLFATRSPHRPNPIALSLVKIDRISSDHVYVCGVDLVDGTPVLDLKPFVPHVDVPPQEAKVFSPEWVVNPRFDRALVCFSEEAEAALTTLVEQGSLRWYSAEEVDMVNAALTQVVSLDPRGVIHGRGMYEGAASRLHKSNFTLTFDRLTVEFRPAEDGERRLVIHNIRCTQAVE